MNKSYYYQEFLPSPLLSPYVRCYARLEYKLDKTIRLPSHFIPYGSPYLTVTYQGWIRGQVLPFENLDYTDDHVAGQLLRYFAAYHSGDIGFFSICFKPCSVYYLLKEGMQEFTQKAIDIEASAGHKGKQFIRDIKSTRDTKEMIGIAENFLLQYIMKASPKTDEVDHSISLIRQNPTIPL